MNGSTDSSRGFRSTSGSPAATSACISRSTPATPIHGSLVYLYVEDVDAAAAAIGVTKINEMPWGRDFDVTDPDCNRLRIGTATP